MLVDADGSRHARVAARQRGVLDDRGSRNKPGDVHGHPAPVLELPATWLVLGLEWPEDESLGSMREAAYAVAVSTVPPGFAPPDVEVVYRLAREFGRKHSLRVVFFSDLTRDLDGVGLKWEDVGVEDWMATHRTMMELEVAHLYVTISHRAHAYLCDATRSGITWHYLDGTTEHDPTEKDRVRAAFEAQLDQDWPGYIAGQRARGLLFEHRG
jgi:hypothetical protein